MLHLELRTLYQFSDYNQTVLNERYQEALKQFPYKIVILDDDPTGIQKVHGVHVYTNWEEESILEGFQSDNQMFFILTNSRAFSREKTVQVHQDIMIKIEKISNQLNQPYIIVSRGDSTLRGHFPLESETINKTLSKPFDGEFIIPFFKEGGRFTIENIHYVKIKDKLIPVGDTEFAQDRTFGFKSSHLGDYIEEKSNGIYKKENVTYISLEDLRSFNIDKITKQLLQVNNFNKIVVNAISDDDLKVLSIAIVNALKQGKRFLFRTAASFTKVIGNISNQDLLSKEQMINSNSDGGGLIIVGSYVQKTTQQLQELLKLDFVKPIEFNSDLTLNNEKLEGEITKKIKELDESISDGQTCVIFTKRKQLKLATGIEEKQLAISVKISKGLTRIIRSLRCKPKYIIAKGGITSSQIGTDALNVRKALVLGQALPGIPVWLTDENSKYPNMPYIIFPGNVGEVTDLKELVELLS